MGGAGPVARLIIQIYEAKNLGTKSFSGRCNSLCAVTFDNRIINTQLVKNSTSPHWNEEFTFDVFHNAPERTILITVIEKGSLFRETPIGSVKIPLNYFKTNLEVKGWFPLKNPKRKNPGEIHFCATLIPSEEEDELFALFVKNLDLENNWVVIDPQVDAFLIEDSISSDPNEEYQEPQEIKREKPEEEFQPPQDPQIPEIVSGPIDPDIQRFLDEEKKEQERMLQEFLKQQYQCMACGEGQEPTEILELECDHSYCISCVRTHFLCLWENPALTDIVCCHNNCLRSIPQWALKKALDEEIFEKFIARALQQAIDNCDEMIACPSCGVVVERVQRNQNQIKNVKLAQGQSAEAHAHREEFRFRCRECNTEYCSSCMRIPYHGGYTCKKYVEYLESRRCRFCKETIRAAVDLSDPLDDVCADDECQEKKKNACERKHDCGHPCGGVRGEEICLPCMHEDCVKPDQTNAEDWCSICYVEDLGSAPSVQLQCSHILHYQCIATKLQQKWPSPRITFGFWNCPECKQKINHPSLEKQMEPLEELYSEITKKALQRLSFEGLEKSDDIVKEGGRFYKDPTAYAMNHFAYYPCYQCKKPYFGGQVRCDAGNNDQPFKAEDLVCGGCSGVGAQECPAHGKEFMEHKCQFCCSVASWFCWEKHIFVILVIQGNRKEIMFLSMRKTNYHNVLEKTNVHLRLNILPMELRFVLAARSAEIKIFDQKLKLLYSDSDLPSFAPAVFVINPLLLL